MEWYYVREGRRYGPIPDSEFDDLARSGVITAQTLVWNSGMPEWKAFGALQPAEPAPVGPSATRCFCSLCGRPQPDDSLVLLGPGWMCGDCKAVYLQQLREGTPRVGTLVYGGFWIRFAAVFLDGLILGGVNIALNALSSMAVGPLTGGAAVVRSLAATGILWIISVALALAYQIYFLTRHAATPGKAAFRLKVITVERTPMSAGRATGRYFSQMLTSMTLGVGYLIAAFDAEKRALHDHICNTRVVRVS